MVSRLVTLLKALGGDLFPQLGRGWGNPPLRRLLDKAMFIFRHNLLVGERRVKSTDCREN